MARTFRRASNDEQTTKRKRRYAVGKGFYIALCLCLIAVGGMAVTTFSDSLNLMGESEPTYTTLATVTTTSASPAAAHTAAVTTVTTTPTTSTTAKETALFVLPLSNRVMTSFSDTPIYSETMEDYRVHLGVDFGGEEGQSVRALADGTVADVAEDALWGTSLTITHGGDIVSVYRGINANVDEGDAVAVGDEIGFVETSPCEKAMGSHLHVELYRGETAIDPSTLLSGQLTTVNRE